MKRTFIFMLAVTFAISVFSQESQSVDKKSKNDTEIKTIFGNKKHGSKIPLGYFMELNAGYTKFGDNDVFLPGMSMGLILNHHWTIGLTGSFIGNFDGLYYPDIYYNENEKQMNGAYLFGGYGGGLFEYILLPNSVVHVSFPLMIGGGYLEYNDVGNFWDLISEHGGWGYESIDYCAFFTVEPGIKCEFNVIKNMRIGLTVSYRYAPNLDLMNTPADLINQFNAKLHIRFGKF